MLRFASVLMDFGGFEHATERERLDRARIGKCVVRDYWAKKRAGRAARSVLLPGLQSLLQWCTTGWRATSVGQVIDHTGLIAAERPGTRGVQADRVRNRAIGRARRGNGEGISVFTRRSARTRRQEVVNKATRGRRGRAGASTAKVR
jgi:hypothetical protein